MKVYLSLLLTFFSFVSFSQIVNDLGQIIKAIDKGEDQFPSEAEFWRFKKARDTTYQKDWVAHEYEKFKNETKENLESFYLHVGKVDSSQLLYATTRVCDTDSADCSWAQMLINFKGKKGDGDLFVVISYLDGIGYKLNYLRFAPRTNYDDHLTMAQKAVNYGYSSYFYDGVIKEFVVPKYDNDTCFVYQSLIEGTLKDDSYRHTIECFYELTSCSPDKHGYLGELCLKKLKDKWYRKYEEEYDSLRVIGFNFFKSAYSQKQEELYLYDMYDLAYEKAWDTVFFDKVLTEIVKHPVSNVLSNKLALYYISRRGDYEKAETLLKPVLQDDSLAAGALYSILSFKEKDARYSYLVLYKRMYPDRFFINEFDFWAVGIGGKESWEYESELTDEEVTQLGLE